MTITEPTAAVPAPPVPRINFPGLRRFLRRYRQQRVAIAATVVLLVIVTACVAAPWIAPYPPDALDIPNALAPPSPEHLLGSDALGRDTFSRLLYGGRISLLAATIAVAVAVGIGVPLGLLAGYTGGKVDWVIGRLADVFMAFPGLVLAIGIIAATGPGLIPAMVGVGIVFGPRLLRVVRGSTLAVRAETYVAASISIGTSTPRILVRRVLPNIMSVLFVQISFLFATALLTEAGLSVLGLGVQPPTPSWGNLLGQGFTEIRATPGLVLWPGLTIAVATLCFNLIGDGLNDSLGRETRKGD